MKSALATTTTGAFLATVLSLMFVSGCDPPTRYRVLSTLFDDVPLPGTERPPRQPRRRRRDLPGSNDALAVPTPTPTPVVIVPPIEEVSRSGWHETLTALPKSVAGGPDWMKALRSGVIAPRVALQPEDRLPVPLLLDIEFVPDDATMKVVFPHAAHTQWLICPNCHPSIFEMKKGANPVTMPKIFAGNYCGKCHGKMAFGLGECARCHTRLAPPPEPVIAAEVAEAESNPISSSSKLIRQGQAVYNLKCVPCHGDEGDGEGPLASSLTPRARDFVPGKYKFRTTPGGALPTDRDIYRTITAGVPGTTMPAWQALSREDRWALVHYLKTFSELFEKEEPPEPREIRDPSAVTPEMLAEGKQLYVDAGCNACHGELGTGDGESAEGLVDDWGYPIRPFDFTSTVPMKGGPAARDVYRTIMTGLTGTPMPDFGDVLETEQGWAIASYVISLRPQPETDLPAEAASSLNFADLEPQVMWAAVEEAASTSIPSNPELLSRGKELYDANCAICHGENGDGVGPAVEVLVPKPRDFVPGKYKFRTTPGGALPTDGDIFRTITVGVPGTSMPAWGLLGNEDRWALVHYLKTFSEQFEKEEPPEPREIPDPPLVSPELLDEGKQLYVDAGCNACHGDLGKGDGESAEGLVDDWGHPIRPFDFTSTTPMKGGPAPQDAYRTIMTGLTGTPMPDFGEVLEPEQGWAITVHVLSLRPGDKRLRGLDTATSDDGQVPAAARAN